MSSDSEDTRGAQLARVSRHPTVHPSSSSNGQPYSAPELNPQQATFLAGAAVSQAHHAANVANQAASAAHYYHHESLEAQRVAALAQHHVAQREEQFAQAATEYQRQARDAVEGARRETLDQLRGEAIAYVDAQREALSSQYQGALDRERQRLEALAEHHVGQLQQSAEAQAIHDRLTLESLANQAQHQVALRDHQIQALQVELQQLRQANELARSPVPAIPLTPSSVTTVRVENPEIGRAHV